jgi:phage shock protein A
VSASRRGGLDPACAYENGLADAEATLTRLRDRQAEAEAVEAAIDDLDAAQNAEGVADALAREGFGPAREPRAADILARLKEKAAAAHAA